MPVWLVLMGWISLQEGACLAGIDGVDFAARGCLFGWYWWGEFRCKRVPVKLALMGLILLQEGQIKTWHTSRHLWDRQTFIRSFLAGPSSEYWLKIQINKIISLRYIYMGRCGSRSCNPITICLVDELRQESFVRCRRKKKKNLHFASGRRKK